MAVTDSWVEGGFGLPPCNDFRCYVATANGMSAVACYLRMPGEAAHRPFAVDVLRIEDGLIAEMTTFPLAGLVHAFGLPETIS